MHCMHSILSLVFIPSNKQLLKAISMQQNYMYVQTESDKGPKNQNGVNLASVNPTAFVIDLYRNCD